MVVVVLSLGSMELLLALRVAVVFIVAHDRDLATSFATPIIGTESESESGAATTLLLLLLLLFFFVDFEKALQTREGRKTRN